MTRIGAAWLLQTARNLIGDAYRKRDRERVGLRDLASSTPTDSSFAHAELRIALSTLAPADREVLELFYWDGLSADEIAVVVGCRTSAAWKRLSRARAALRSLLTDDPADTGNAIRRAPRRAEGGVVSYAMD
ncbi:RNA polymerase sigma factor (sigma-70 family) [Microbacterium sp. W4I4]|uniref:RNA polymerase sigma factor n=1 Tax=Microbacterium sp. W4I4 TaxID=3042295 RepID=UPI00277E68AC|nr:sigma-70 family RNA polymerase sigma factor [Microbacterium sp. W4I4]MDQ0613554.1 RNA polymerase sigma factor (sigma-70 family) [Microbacterium sp. W4I4]